MTVNGNPVGIYLLKVNNRNTRIRCSKLVRLNSHVVKEIQLTFLRKSFVVSNGRICSGNATAIFAQQESDLQHKNKNSVLYQ